MTKRTADASIDNESIGGSPASKRLRMEVVDRGRKATPPLQEHRWEDDERKGADILAAADQEAEEVEEAAGHTSDWENEEPLVQAPLRQAEPMQGYSDLYLDTIQRANLDFDFEKLCSVTLSNINVYACLVCGKYFQGRGPKSHAYFHSLEVGHHVFVNMETKKVYVLPEGYEVKNKSLDDIKYVIDPTYTKEEVSKLDTVVIQSWDLAGRKYRPGNPQFPPQLRSRLLTILS